MSTAPAILVNRIMRQKTENTPAVMQGFITLIPCLVKLSAASAFWHLDKNEGDSHENIERSGSYGTHSIS